MGRKRVFDLKLEKCKLRECLNYIEIGELLDVAERVGEKGECCRFLKRGGLERRWGRKREC
jgi:hypothetical protein